MAEGCTLDFDIAVRIYGGGRAEPLRTAPGGVKGVKPSVVIESGSQCFFGTLDSTTTCNHLLVIPIGHGLSTRSDSNILYPMGDVIFYPSEYCVIICFNSSDITHVACWVYFTIVTFGNFLEIIDGTETTLQIRRSWAP
ncbi:uncharacterized protein LOC125510634 [Triticum urartu]|uniref:uncharacterized protein LOC125510634 n=1 Tax=Triticum urartu TaxID=4572 RepID=UPI002043D374|nr:uncharacterized protein LOC125510634 [Triticum urartu]